ncbi:MAG: thioredoxin family protein [Acidimicrobiia bacterium]
MGVRLGVAAAILAVAALVAWRLRRRPPEAPPRDAHPIPRQLARADFPRSDASWLVAYFSSATCAGCQGLGPKVEVLECSQVATAECSFEADRDLHERYDISAIPMILVADHDGVVHRAFIGATTATDLWAAVAEVRSPGTTPEPTLGELEV